MADLTEKTVIYENNYQNCVHFSHFHHIFAVYPKTLMSDIVVFPPKGHFMFIFTIYWFILLVPTRLHSYMRWHFYNSFQRCKLQKWTFHCFFCPIRHIFFFDNYVQICQKLTGVVWTKQTFMPYFGGKRIALVFRFLIIKRNIHNLFVFNL